MSYSYLDHSAYSPIAPEVLKTYVQALQQMTYTPGNPSSLHKGGLLAREKLESAREKIAKIICVKPSEVIFTSGGTEADNLGFISAAKKIQEKSGRNVAITSAIEHPGISSVYKILGKDAINVIKIPVTSSGVVDLEVLEKIIRQHFNDISVISVMLVNNETGVIQPVKEIVQLVREIEQQLHRTGDRIFVHTDAVQGFGHIPFNFVDLGVDAMSISGHKISAPVGIGALIAKQDFPVGMIYSGGGQERGVRSGTIDVCGALALSVACEKAIENLDVNIARFSEYKAKIVKNLPDGVSVSSTAECSSHILHLVCEYGGADALLFSLDNAGICVSAGSACRAGVAQSSYVLEAMGYDGVYCSGGLRISFGSSTTMDDIDALIDALPLAVESAKSLHKIRFVG